MKRAILTVVALVAGLAAVPPAFAQGKALPKYEPTQRQRTALDTCLKDEVMNGPNCVKKCQADFRLDLKGKKPVCVAVKPDAKYVEVAPTWKPPAKRPASGAQGY